MVLPSRFRISSDELPEGAPASFSLVLEPRREGWVLETPVEFRGPDIAIPTRPDVDKWVGKACGRWLESTGPGLWRLKDEGELRELLAFLGRPSPDMTPEEIAAEEERIAEREAFIRRRDARNEATKEEGLRLYWRNRARQTASAERDLRQFHARFAKPDSHLRRRSFEVVALPQGAGGLDAVHPLAIDHLVIGGSDGRLWVSMMAGREWKRVEMPGTDAIRELDGAADALRATSPGVAWISRDGGYTFEPIGDDGSAPPAEPGEDSALHEARAAAGEGARLNAATVSEQVAIAVGVDPSGRPLLLRREAPSAPWESVDVSALAPEGNELLDAWAGSPDDIWACGEGGLLLFSFDAGRSWQRENLESAERLTRVRGRYRKQLWVLGERCLWRSNQK